MQRSVVEVDERKLTYKEAGVDCEEKSCEEPGSCIPEAGRRPNLPHQDLIETWSTLHLVAQLLNLKPIKKLHLLKFAMLENLYPCNSKLAH